MEIDCRVAEFRVLTPRSTHMIITSGTLTTDNFAACFFSFVFCQYIDLPPVSPP